MKTTNKQKLSSRIDGRLAAYATLAGAALAVPALAPNADATIITQTVNINIPTTTSGVYLNVATGANSTSPASAPGWDVNPWGSTFLDMFNPSAPSGGVYNGNASGYFNLTIGAVISGASTWGSGAINPATPLNFNSSNNYVGFRFQDETNGNQIEYGYMQISLSGTQSSQPRAIVLYSYDNTGAGITVVPEPTTAALLGVMAAGALGVRAWRKRKAA